MDALAMLRTRSSTPSRLLRAPGPDASELGQLLTLAMRVPDHGKLLPWRFLVIEGDARVRLADTLLARRLVLEPDAAAEVLEKDRLRFLHAPVIVTVVAMLTPNHKIPEVEQLASGAAVCMQLLNAVHASGFAAQWLTGWAAYDHEILAALGLGENEQVSGFVHIGRCDQPPVERTRPELSAKLSFF